MLFIAGGLLLCDILDHGVPSGVTVNLGVVKIISSWLQL